MKPNGHNNKPLHFTNYLMDQNYGLYIEDYFTELLSYERKRTERSKRPFLLMLLDINGLHINNGKDGIVKKISSVLFSSTREIDVKGWYKNGSVIGVLFTELNGVNKESLREKIFSKFYSVLEIQQVRKIEASFFAFPEDGDESKTNTFDCETLYPDIVNKKDSNKIIKRVIDVFGSLVCILIFSPLFLIIPIIIRATSKGPILFRQERIGQFGKKFTFMKFRTMYLNNDSKIHQDYIKKFIFEQGSYEAKDNSGGGGTVYKIKDDPRVTAIGRFLRKTSLDELPQFINVLKGDMSLVGPRPPLAYEVAIYDIWHRRRVMEVKPGITGLWQTKGRSSTTFNEMVRLDIRYIKEKSVWLDIKILFLTPWVVLTGKGAY
ncbi:MAG: sugar transferase [Nitrospira sp.]|nr:sugar transferase [Nitrospira sp.]